MILYLNTYEARISFKKFYFIIFYYVFYYVFILIYSYFLLNINVSFQYTFKSCIYIKIYIKCNLDIYLLSFDIFLKLGCSKEDNYLINWFLNVFGYCNVQNKLYIFLFDD